MDNQIEIKKINASELLNDLKSGLTRWKKDDKGFGSIEEKYGYTFTEMKQVVEFPKLKGVKTLIPSLIIIDDLPEKEEKENKEEKEQKEEVLITKIEVSGDEGIKSSDNIKLKKKIVEAFI